MGFAIDGEKKVQKCCLVIKAPEYRPFKKKIHSFPTYVKYLGKKERKNGFQKNERTGKIFHSGGYEIDFWNLKYVQLILVCFFELFISQLKLINFFV